VLTLSIKNFLFKVYKLVRFGPGKIIDAYKQFKADVEFNKHERIRYFTFWTLNHPIRDNWFRNFITHHKIQKEKRINIISPGGSKYVVNFITKSEPRIFFNSENSKSNLLACDVWSDHLRGKVDLALGFYDEVDKHNNYMRFPFWILYLVPFDASLEDLKKLIDKYNSIENRNNSRNQFAVLISRFDFNGIRSEMINSINQIQHVSCAGNFANNTKDLFEKYNNNKLEYLKEFKFNICPENTNSDGYVTEKLFEAIQAGCIPIYWGSDNLPEPSILNHDAILFYDRNNPQKVIDEIKRIYNSKEAHDEFISRKPFKEDAAEHIFLYIQNLKTRLKQVVDKY